MNGLRGEDFHQVLKPIDVEAIELETELAGEPKKEEGAAWGNSYRPSHRNQDELSRDAFLGMAQVYMNNYKKPLSEAQKRYQELCKIPTEELLGKNKQEEIDELIPDESLDLDTNDDILSYSLDAEPEDELESGDNYAQNSDTDNIFTSGGHNDMTFDTAKYQYQSDEKDLQDLDAIDSKEGYTPSKENFFLSENEEYHSAA